MKLVWSGTGCFVPVVSLSAGLAFSLALSGPDKGAYWTWALLALALGAVFLALGLFINSSRRVAERSGESHHFMYAPVELWGGLLLIGAVGLFVAEAVDGDLFAGAAPSASPCEELGHTLQACPSLGPAAGMMQMGCEMSAPEVQASCLACVQASTDPCNPGRCADACRFGPPRPGP